MAEALHVSTKTITRRLEQLQSAGLVTRIPGSRPQTYEVRTFRLCPDKADAHSGQGCPQGETDLSASALPQQGGTPLNDELSAPQPMVEREQAKERLSERETQACSSLSEELLEAGFSRERACRLLSECGEQPVSAALSALREQEHVSNPAGWLVEYLRTNGWDEKRWLEDLLLSTPDPDTAAERDGLVEDLKRRLGPCNKVLEALERLRAAEMALRDSAAEGSQQANVAGEVASLAAEAIYYVDEYLRCHPEELGDPVRRAEAFEMRALMDTALGRASSPQPLVSCPIPSTATLARGED